jgi:protein involved in polysaccharide export with SLBB domain
MDFSLEKSYFLVYFDNMKSLFIVTSLLLCFFQAVLVSAQTPVVPEIAPEIDPAVAEKLKAAAVKVGVEETSNDTVIEETKNIENENEEDKEDEERKIKFDSRQSNLPDARIWGQQYFRDQSISLFTRSRDIKAIDSYLLGIGDELAITVWGATDYSASVAIDEEGFISLTNPTKGVHIPRLYIREMKFSDVKKAVEERLKNHMNLTNSQISIELNYSRSLTVNITGEVFNPGSYTFPAVNTAFNGLVAAGGPSQIGSVRKIKVVSSEYKTRTLDVYKFLNSPNVADDFFLFNNDYIYVPLAERVVAIEGSIERPFFYELIEGEHLIELIKYAGGLQSDAYRRNIQVLRYENDEEKLIDVNLSELIRQKKNFKLLNGDRISINPIKQAFSNYITVVGAVKLPGTYQLQQASTIYDVLMKAGVIRSAVMERIYIKRLREDLSLNYIAINVHKVLDDPMSPDNIVLNPFDEIEVKFKSDFIDKYQVKIFGAVRKPGNYAYSDSLSLNDLLYMANGIRREASNSYIEVSRLNIDNNNNKTYVKIKRLDIQGLPQNLTVESGNEFKLKPYDQIFVRKSKEFENIENVTIEGEITWPGIYAISKEKERVYDLIERAGGWTNIAFLKGAKLIRMEEGLVLLDLETLKKDGPSSKFNYILRKDDRIIIPKIRDLVSIAGRINHPLVKENAEIDQKKLDLELEKVETEIEKKEILLERFIAETQNPRKINLPYHPNKRANFYVREYGAGIDWKLGGRKRLIYVRYANGLVKKTRSFLFFKCYPKVEKGAMVYVDSKIKKVRKERKPIDWYKVITDSFALIVSGFTVYALVNALR